MNDLAAAFAAHGAGRLEEAERGYRAVLAAEPGQADAWHLLGVIAQQRGQSAQAVEHIRRALAVSGPRGAYLANLGVALEALGQSSEAATALEQAVALEPGSFTAQFALANALRSLGRLDEAAGRYRHALTIEPASASAHNNLGNALQDLGRAAEAEACYRRTIALQPTHARAHYNLGIILKDAGRLEAAAESFRRALAIAPDLAEAHVNLGVVLHDQGQLEDAVLHCRKAIALNPKDAAAFNNLGAVLRDLGQMDEAMACYSAAIALRPTMAEAQHNEGIALHRMGRDDEALERYRNAHKLNSGIVEAEHNAALLMLMCGDFKAGWEAYECRWRANAPERGWRNFPHPPWHGEDSKQPGKDALLVWGEQGVGDTVLYASMVPDLLARGYAVVMETDRRLVSLFARSFPGVDVVAKHNPPDTATARADIRWHSPLASLGRWLRPDVESFPQRTAYLVADPGRRARYRTILESDAGADRLVVGISWISRNTKIGTHKTLDLRQWSSILQVPGVQFVDLQYGDTADERAAVEAELGVKITHMADLDLREDIDGVAALAAACDLVISVSNTTVHLSAALGRPTWILVPASVGNLWYWMRASAHTPWYPSATIFRQSKLGEWQGVLAEVKKRLTTTAETKSPLQQIN